MNQDEWYFKKEVNISHLVSTLLLAIGGFWFIADIDKRVESNAQQILFVAKQHVSDIKRVGQQRDEDVQRVEKRLDSIDRKLDRLLADK